MTFVELVENISFNTKVEKHLVSKVLKMFQSEVELAVLNDEPVHLRNFGTFYTKTLAPKTLFGGKATISTRKRIRFRESRKHG